MASDEQIGALTERFGDAVADLWNMVDIPDRGDSEYATANQCWDELLAEVERLRAREAALLAFAEMVEWNAGVSSYLREQARALLAAE